MTKAKQNGDKPQVIPGLEGLPEIPTIAGNDDGGVRTVAGGQEGGPDGAGQDQQSPQGGEGQPAVDAPAPAPAPAPVKAAPKKAAEPKSPVQMVLDAHPHDMVGGRHLAIVDGAHVWLTNIENGLHVLTFEGQKLFEVIRDRG